MAGAAERGRIFEGMQIEIDRAAPHDSHLRVVAHVLLDDRLPDHRGLVLESDRDGLAVAGEAVEGEGRAPGVNPRIVETDECIFFWSRPHHADA
jgi:hypothetical protein